MVPLISITGADKAQDLSITFDISCLIMQLDFVHSGRVVDLLNQHQHLHSKSNSHN